MLSAIVGYWANSTADDILSQNNNFFFYCRLNTLGGQIIITALNMFLNTYLFQLKNFTGNGKCIDGEK